MIFASCRVSILRSTLKTGFSWFNLHQTRLSKNATMSTQTVDSFLMKHDNTQVQYLMEECILVTDKDESIGSASKKECHLLENINKGMLHRAFSVFLFNSKNELLLQQRSASKITYPLHFTNTCCSHPLNRERERDGVEGVKVAAQRKLEHELGISSDDMPLEAFHYLTRIHYMSRNVPDDDMFGEHEIDYILFAKRDVSVTPNENEVKSYTYVSQNELKRLIDESEKTGTLITPWFRLIASAQLYQWWSDLDNLAKHNDHQTIHKF